MKGVNMTIEEKFEYASMRFGAFCDELCKLDKKGMISKEDSMENFQEKYSQIVEEYGENLKVLASMKCYRPNGDKSYDKVKFIEMATKMGFKIPKDTIAFSVSLYPVLLDLSKKYDERNVKLIPAKLFSTTIVMGKLNQENNLVTCKDGKSYPITECENMIECKDEPSRLIRVQEVENIL